MIERIITSLGLFITLAYLRVELRISLDTCFLSMLLILILNELQKKREALTVHKMARKYGDYFVSECLEEIRHDSYQGTDEWKQVTCKPCLKRRR